MDVYSPCLRLFEYFAQCLAQLGGIGERGLEHLASDLALQSHEGATAGTVLAGASAVGLAETTERGMHLAAAEAAELGDFERDLRASPFQVR